MEVSITGTKSKATASRLLEAAHFYGDLLFSNRLSDRISLQVEIKKRVDKEGRMTGWCDWTDDASRPREFVIQLKRMSVPTMLKSLAHEMVHVRQYATGQLRQLVTGTYRWNDEYIDIGSGVCYWDLPFEIEAFGREVGLYRRFMDRSKALDNS